MQLTQHDKTHVLEESPTIRARLYDMVEIPVDASVPSGGDPYRLGVKATFTHENGRALTVAGFYGGPEAGHLLRFMPTETGRWSYAIRVGDADRGRGEIDAGDSDLPGPLKQDPDRPYHFVTSNGRPFYMMGNTSYNALTAYRNKREQYFEFLDYYHERRFNWMRFWIQQTIWPTCGGIVWPWGGTHEEPDYSVYDERTFRDAEGVISALAERGMIASVILLHPADLFYRKMGDEKVGICREFISYAVARLGAYWNVVWNLANEWERAFNFTYDEMDELGAHLDSCDAHDHLTACHHYSRFDFYDRPWTDMSSMQHRALPGEVNRVALQNRCFAKPVVNEEYGYEGDNLGPPNDPDNVRHDSWALAMAGAYGTYGDKTKGPKISVYFSSVLEDSIDACVPDMLKHLHAFMETTRYRTMCPANMFVSSCDANEVFCLAEPGREYVVYCVRGQPFNLCLTHARGSYDATWFDPRSGTRTGPRSLEFAPHKPEGTDDKAWAKLTRDHDVSFDPPDHEHDWVLHVTRREVTS